MMVNNKAMPSLALTGNDGTARSTRAVSLALDVNYTTFDSIPSICRECELSRDIRQKLVKALSSPECQAYQLALSSNCLVCLAKATPQRTNRGSQNTQNIRGVRLWVGH